MLLKDIFEMSAPDLSNTENTVDAMFRDLGLDVIFTQHFKNRILDQGTEARDIDVSSEEIVNAFAALKAQYGKALMKAKHNKEEFVGILKDISTKLNIPFAIDYDKIYSGLHKLTATTLMRKQNFKPNSIYDKVLPVKSRE
jgi:CRISPR/Cas system CSM-associated protein Csm2 small subunit